jgi:hypothetical protein
MTPYQNSTRMVKIFRKKRPPSSKNAPDSILTSSNDRYITEKPPRVLRSPIFRLRPSCTKLWGNVYSPPHIVRHLAFSMRAAQQKSDKRRDKAERIFGRNEKRESRSDLLTKPDMDTAQVRLWSPGFVHYREVILGYGMVWCMVSGYSLRLGLTRSKLVM